MKRALVLLIVGVGASTAVAEPVHVRTEHCAIASPGEPGRAATRELIDRAALDLAVGRELALDPKLARIAQQITIVLECDELHARIRIDPDPADGPLSRDLDLSDEPAELRVKLVALSIAELVDVLAAAPVNQPTLASRPVVSMPIASQPQASAAPEATAQVEAPSRGPKITVRGGIRLFADDQDPMPTVSADIEVGPVQLGLVTSIGDNHRFNGLPYIVAITVSRRLICSDGPTSLCMLARGEVGFAGISIGGSAEMDSVHTEYGDVALGFEIERRFREWNALAGFEVGTAEGLVMDTSPYLEHLNGPFAVVGIGVKF